MTLTIAKSWRLLLIPVLASLSERASGSLVVWQTADPLSANSYMNNEGFGARLDLRCDVTAGPCSWRIRTQIFIEEGTSGNYDVQIRDPAGSATTLRVSQSSIAGSPYSNLQHAFENGIGY